MPKESETNLEKRYKTLLEFVDGLDISQEEMIERIKLPDMNPAVSFYRTIVAASQEIQDKIRDKKLDISDKYQSSILRLLEVGDKIAKTVSAAKMEAYPLAEPVSQEPESLGDRKR